MGYTPLFDTLTKGTLCGRWPDIGLWPVVLSLTDKNGVVDCTPAYIAGVTGLALDDVIACMKRFCQPDPYSRTQDHNGARLELLDAHRDWGWRVVNHGKYREKARKAAYDSERTSSGKDADRKRHEREASREVPRSPDESRAVPLSDSNADSDSNSDKNTQDAREGVSRDDEAEHAEWLVTRDLYPPNPQRADWIGAEKAARRLVENGETWESLRAGVSRYAACVAATNRLVLNPLKFFTDTDKPWAQAWPIPPPPKNFADRQAEGVRQRFLREPA